MKRQNSGNRRALSLSAGVVIAVVVIVIAGVFVYYVYYGSSTPKVGSQLTAATTAYSVTKTNYSYNPFNQVATTTEYMTTCSFTINGVAVGNGSALTTTTVATTTNCISSALSSSTTNK